MSTAADLGYVSFKYPKKLIIKNWERERDVLYHYGSFEKIIIYSLIFND